jgi:protein arginine kinase activator
MGMKCEVETCENEATVHLTEIREGKKHEMHLCERCAAEKGLPGKSHFSISDLLAGIASQAQVQATKPSKRGKEAACPVCTTTLSQFQSSGRFGCPECYSTFRDDVQGLVEKIHDASQHVGKVPHRVSSEISLQKDVRQLQLELKRAIRKEDYEKAANLRDQIRQFEEKLEKAEAPGKTEGDAEGAAPAGPAKAPPPPKPAPPGNPGSHGHSKKKNEGGEKK